MSINNPNSDVLIVDGLNTYIRAYSTSPVVNDNGLHVGGTTGFLLSIGSAIKLFRPTRVILTFDGRGGSARRREVYSEYKSNRKPNSPILRNKESTYFGESPEESMKRQMHLLMCLLKTLPVSLMAFDGVEADDIIGYVASTLKAPDSAVRIMSTDKDFLQLVNDRVTVWNPTQKKIFDRTLVETIYGISVQNFGLYRAITGDKSDNIKGIPGIQAKTLAKLFPEFRFADKLDIDDLAKLATENYSIDPKKKLYKVILDSIDIIKVNYQIMRLDEIDISGSAKSRIMEIYNNTKVDFNRMEFLKILSENSMVNSIRNVHVWSNEVFNRLEMLGKFE